MNTNKEIARMAGLFYLIFILLSILVKVLGRSSMIVLGDAAATAQNITASEGLFRLSFMSDLLSAVFFLLAAWALYALLKPVNKKPCSPFLIIEPGRSSGTVAQPAQSIRSLTAAGWRGLFEHFPDQSIAGYGVVLPQFT